MSRINTVDNGLEGLGFRIPNDAHIPTSSRRGVDHLAVPSTDNEAETFFNNILDRYC